MSSAPLNIPRNNAVAFRAILALTLIVISYIFAIAVAAACVVLPAYALTHGFGGIIGLIVVILGLIMAGTILWSLVPRREQFKPSGVPLDLAQHPRLQALIAGIASRLGERVPASIYLLPEPNAFVTDRGGILGSGGKRIMGLGLPLLASMTVSEFSAVVAHEFAHFYSGDTRLGPRIYQTNSAMARAMRNLASDSIVVKFLTRFGAAALLYTVVIHGMVAYWKLFLRATQMISRHQEYRSDELACYVAGPAAMAQGLERITMISAIASSFWGSVVNPAIGAGYRPPLADGLHRYFNAPAIHKAASDSLATVLKNCTPGAYDTHPPMKLRLDRISAIKIETEYVNDSSPAILLLDNLDVLEQELLQKLLPDPKAPLAPMDWDSAGATVWLPFWRKFVAEYVSLLAGQTIDSIPALLRDLHKIGAQIRDPPGILRTPEQRVDRAAGLVSTALAIQLIENGWALHTQPGELFFSKGDLRVVPRQLIQAIQTGKTTASNWQTWCEENGLASIPLTGKPSAAQFA